MGAMDLQQMQEIARAQQQQQDLMPTKDEQMRSMAAQLAVTHISSGHFSGPEGPNASAEDAAALSERYFRFLKGGEAPPEQP